MGGWLADSSRLNKLDQRNLFLYTATSMRKNGGLKMRAKVFIFTATEPGFKTMPTWNFDIYNVRTWFAPTHQILT